MTRPILPPSGIPESLVSEVNALYRESASAEPPAVLDQRILAAARAEVSNARAGKAKRPMPWWKMWMSATSAIAVAVLGVSVSLRIMDQQERDLRQATSFDESRPAADKAPAGGAAIERPERPVSPPASRAKAKIELPSRADLAPPPPAAPQASPEKQTASRKEALRDDSVVAGSLNRSAEARQAPEVMAAPASAPAARPPAEALKKSGSRERDAAAKAEASAGLAASAPARLADDAATPEAWLKHVRDLRAAGRYAEAVQSLARMRVRYPEFVLPDDMK